MIYFIVFSIIIINKITQVEVPSGSDLWSDQVQRTPCVPRPKLQGLGFGSGAQSFD